MNRFKIIQTIGQTQHGDIYKAIKIENNEQCMIEELKNQCGSWEECISLRQVKVLRVVNHPNIIKLKEIIRQHKVLYLVFEYIPHNLSTWYNELSDQRMNVSENNIKKIIQTIGQAIYSCHHNGIVHRNICPENIYVQGGNGNNGNLIAKLGSFSNAEFYQRQNFTEYVTNRWYRSPEAILKLNPGFKIDVWALGCIMVELYLQEPFFHGQTEQDQLMRILKVMGVPNHKEYPEFHTLCQQKNIELPQFEGIKLHQILPQISPLAIDLITQMLNVNPHKRLSIAKVLSHSFFLDSDSKPIQIIESKEIDIAHLSEYNNSHVQMCSIESSSPGQSPIHQQIIQEQQFKSKDQHSLEQQEEVEQQLKDDKNSGKQQKKVRINEQLEINKNDKLEQQLQQDQSQLQQQFQQQQQQKQQEQIKQQQEIKQLQLQQQQLEQEILEEKQRIESIEECFPNKLSNSKLSLFGLNSPRSTEANRINLSFKAGSHNSSSSVNSPQSGKNDQNKIEDNFEHSKFNQQIQQLSKSQVHQELQYAK